MIQVLIIFSISYYTGLLIDSPASSFPGYIPLHIMVPDLLSNHMAKYIFHSYKLTQINIPSCMYLYSQPLDAHIYARRNLSLLNSPCFFTTLLWWNPLPSVWNALLVLAKSQLLSPQCMPVFLRVEFTVLTFLPIGIFIYNSYRSSYALLQSFCF